MPLKEKLTRLRGVASGIASGVCDALQGRSLKAAWAVFRDGTRLAWLIIKF